MRWRRPDLNFIEVSGSSKIEFFIALKSEVFLPDMLQPMAPNGRVKGWFQTAAAEKDIPKKAEGLSAVGYKNPVGVRFCEFPIKQLASDMNKLGRENQKVN